MKLDDLEAQGVLEPLTASAEELGRLLDAAARRLADAKVASVSNEGRFQSAYHAVLNCALAAIRANDLRLDIREGKHGMALSTLESTIGLSTPKIQLLQKMRQRRNIDLYEGDLPISDLELEKALEVATQVVAMTKQYVAQLRLNL